MPSDLPALPIELVERVITYLETQEIGFLRLACRQLRDKASQGSYLALFTHRSVDLTETSLASLTNTLQSDIPLARKLRDLSLVAVCFDPSQADGQRSTNLDDFYRPPFQAMIHKDVCRSRKKFTKSDKRFASRLELATLRLQQAQHQWNVEKGLYPALLSSTFSAVKSTCENGELANLRLTAAVLTSTTIRFTPDAHDYKLTSSEESFLLATALDALASTELTVRSLDIFSKTRLCGVPCAELASYLTHNPITRLRSLGASLQQLSLRYSRVAISTGRGSNTCDMHCCNCNTRRFRRPDEENICHIHRCSFGDEDDLSCTFESILGKFLMIFPNLTKLHLHECETRWVDNEADPNTSAFTHLAKTAHFPYMRELSLHGTNVTEASLLNLLRKTPVLQRLNLVHINLAEGVFSKIISFLRQDKSPVRLSHLSLKDIFEHKRADALNPGSTTNHPAAPPPPPPLPPGPLFPPPPAIMSSGHTQTETYLNTMLAFRLPKAAAAECYLGGCFGSNEITLSGLWVKKAELSYSFVGHASAKRTVEFRWDRERVREFGPLAADPFDAF